ENRYNLGFSAHGQRIPIWSSSALRAAAPRSAPFITSLPPTSRAAATAASLSGSAITTLLRALPRMVSCCRSIVSASGNRRARSFRPPSSAWFASTRRRRPLRLLPRLERRPVSGSRRPAQGGEKSRAAAPRATGQSPGAALPARAELPADGVVVGRVEGAYGVRGAIR